MRLIRLISLTQLSGWLWAFGPCMTCAAVCKQYISRGKSAHVATPSQLLWPLNELSLCSEAKTLGGHGVPPADFHHDVSTNKQTNKETEIYFRLPLRQCFVYLFLWLKMNPIFLVSYRSCKESILLTVVQPYPVSLSVFYEWKGIHANGLFVCLWSWFLLSTPWKQVINHAICLCWHCISNGLAECLSPG